MHHGHVFCPQHLVDRFLLCGVEPRKALRLKPILPRGLVAVEEVAQVGQPVALCRDDATEGFEHGAVAGLVERELYGQILLGSHVGHGEIVGYDEHHAVAVDKRDGCLATVAQRHLFAILEVVLHVEVLRAENLKAVLIE